MHPIAHIRTDLPGKFGVPRQSGLAQHLKARIVFEPDYRNPDALRGIEGYSHLWLIWHFSLSEREAWSPTVRPPKLGGNQRMGVFATRSPFRPNPIGLSCVRLLGLETTVKDGTVLIVGGADLVDGTPIFDIKPYIPYADCHPDATGGFTADYDASPLPVDFDCPLPDEWDQDRVAALTELLAADPRPGYQKSADRVYGFPYAGQEVRFRVADGRVRVSAIEAAEESASADPAP